MWEGYLNQWLLSYLGHFLEYKQEDLKAHALKGLEIQITGAKLKPEALDFLQLPVAVQEGRIGTLLVKCPWGFRGRIVVEISDVYVCATPRTEAQWEEGPAQRRRLAANLAQLGSADMQKASKSLCGSSTSQKGGFGWSLLSWVGSILLNKLQLSVQEVHVCLKVPDGNEAATASCCGLRLGLMQTGHTDKQVQLKLSKAASASKVGRVLKDISMQQLSLYWQVSQTTTSSGSSSLADSTWQHIRHPMDSGQTTASPSENSGSATGRMSDVSGACLLSAETTAVPVPENLPSTAAGADNSLEVANKSDASHFMLHPMSCDLRVSTKTDKRNGMTKFSTLVLMEGLQLQLDKQQICDVVRVMDLFVVWELRNRYAVLRPTGWRSDPDNLIPIRRLWQYAVNAVLQDLGKQQPHKLSSQHLREWRRQRQRAQAREQFPAAPSVAATAAATAAIAPDSASKAPELDHSKPEVPKEAWKSTEVRQGWWAWGMSALGYPPAKGIGENPLRPKGLPSGFTEADMQELRTALSLDSFDHQHGTDSKEPARKLEIGADVKMSGITVHLLDSMPGKPPEQLVSLELEQANTQVSLSPNAATVSGTVQEVVLRDCCSSTSGSSEAMLSRWYQPGSGTSSQSAEQQSTERSSSASLSNSFVVVPGLDSGPPLIKFHYTSAEVLSESPRPIIAPGNSGSLDIQIQHLQLLYHPVCLSRMSGMLSLAPKDTQAAELAQATNALPGRNAHMLAQAQRALKQGLLPLLSVQVEGLAVKLGQASSASSDRHAVLSTGPVYLSHKPHTDAQQQHAIVGQLEQHLRGVAVLSSHGLHELLGQVESQVLYQRFQISIASIQMHIAACETPLQSLPTQGGQCRGTHVLSPCQCTAYLDMHRISDDAQLPNMKALVNLDGIDVQLNPEAVDILGGVLDQQSTPNSPRREHPSKPTAKHAEGGHVIELNITAETLSLCYHDTDTRGRDSDATNVNLRLKGNKFDMLLEAMQDAVVAKVSVAQLHAVDRSKYSTKNPKIYGSHSIPRLAQIMEIDVVTVRCDHSQIAGWMLSARLHGASAKGWSGESGNIITRLSPNQPAQAEFTVYNTRDRLQTSITLQDGCFGTATLMRIAALFMAAPTPPPPLPPTHATHSQPAAVTPDADSDAQAHAADRAGQAESSDAALPDEAEQASSTLHSTQAEHQHFTLPQPDVPGVEDSRSSLEAAPDLKPVLKITSESESSDKAGSPHNHSLPSDAAAGNQQLQLNPSDRHSVQLESKGTSADQSTSDGAQDSDDSSITTNGQPSSSPASTTHSESDHSPTAGMPSVSMPAGQQGLQNASDLLGSGTANHAAEQHAASSAASAMEMLGAQSVDIAQDAASLHDTTAAADLADALPQAGAKEEETAPCSPSAGLEQSREPTDKRCEQFSLEIVRCKTVCPAKTSPTSFPDDDSPLAHTLYMEVPHFLLQLPIEKPAQHPRPHPVILNVRHVQKGQQPAVPAPDVIAPSPFAMDQQQGTICALTNLALFVALPEEFDSVNPSHARTTAHALPQLPPLLSIPTASLLAVGPRAPPCNHLLSNGLPADPVPTLELEMKVAEVIAKPAQLQTMSASTIRYSTEMDIILGNPQDDPIGPVMVAAASSQAAEAKQPSPNNPTPNNLTPNASARQPGFALEASIGLVSLQLHSSQQHRPALVLQWQRLSGHYAWAALNGQPPAAPAFTPLACGLSWHYLSLQLAKDPVKQKTQFSLVNMDSLRSGSLLVPSRLSRAQSDPAVAHMGRAGSTRSSRPGSVRHNQGSSVHGSQRAQGRSSLTRAVSPEEEYMQHQHSLSRLHVAPVGNTRGMGLSGLTALAEIAADDNESVPESVHIFNNRARLASDSFAEALEAVLPSMPSALSLNPGQAIDSSDTASSSLSDSRSHGRSHERRNLHRLMSGGASVASSRISIDQLQRQVPVIRHRPLFMASIPSDDPAMASYATASSDFDHLTGSTHSSQSFRGFHDAAENENNPGGNWSPDIDKLPAGDRLLLLLGSKETLAPNDATLYPNAAEDATIGCIVLPDASDASSLLAMEVCATDMLVRIYLEGWQLLIHSSMECLAAIQRGQQHPKQLKPDTHSHSGTTSLVASVGSKVSVQLHATELVAELIANTQQPDAGSAEHPGISPLSPCISVTTEVLVHSHNTSQGNLQHHLKVPRLAVAAAVLRLAPNIADKGSRDELGLLLGSLGFEAALTMPVLPSTTDPIEGNLQLCQGTTQQSKQPMSSETSSSLMSLDLHLQQLSVFASQRRLSTAAALLTVVQQVQDGLHSMTKPRTSTAAEIAVSIKGSSDHLIETLMKMHCSLHARKLALLLSNDTHNNDTPIVEAAACNVNCAISGQNQLREQPQNQNEPQGQLQQLAGATWQRFLQGLTQPSKEASNHGNSANGPLQQLECSGSVVLLVNVYNNALMGWEPLLEPWKVAVNVVRQGSQQLSSQQLRLSLTAEDILEVTLTPAVTSSYQDASRLLEAVTAVANSPSILENSLFAVQEDDMPDGESLYWIQNLTDCPVQFWLQKPEQVQPNQLFQLPDLGEPCNVKPQATESLLPQDCKEPSCKGYHVGSPQLFIAELPSQLHPSSSSSSSPTSFDLSNSHTAFDIDTEDIRQHTSNLDPAAAFLQSEAPDGQCPCSSHVVQSTSGSDAVSADLLHDSSTTEQGGATEVVQAAWVQQESTCHRQAGLKVLVKLQGQGSAEQPLGSWGLDEEQRTSKEVSLCKLTKQGNEAMLRFRVYCNISREVRGGAGITLHSGISLHNSLEVWLCVGVYQNWLGTSQADQPQVTQLVGPRASIWLPALCCNATYFSLQPAGYSLLLRAPIELYNALPIPVNIGLKSSHHKQGSWRVTVQPLQTCLLNQAGAFQDVQSFQLEPTGYAASPNMHIPNNAGRSRCDIEGYEVLGKVTMDISKNNREEGSVSLTVTHCVDTQSGSHALRLSCPLWVYNCTSLPIAVKQSVGQDHKFGHVDEDVLPERDAQAGRVPTAWIPPYKGPSQRPPPRSTSSRRLPLSYSPTHSSETSSMNTRSRFSLSGLGGVLTSPSMHSGWAGQQSGVGSSPKGMTDAGQVAALFQESTRYASMQGKEGPHKALQLCATTSVMAGGKALWSGPVQLNALGAAAVLEVPCPTQPVHQRKDKLPGYRVAVTAVQIPNGDGALALHVMPRYVLHNNLKQALQYKQQGTTAENNLLAGAARAVHWSDINQKDLRLCLRLQETGQQWSGGFALDAPGDLFVKIRHREHEITRLIRVDVSSSANGVLAVALSEQERGFAPYRLDNCTGLRLHLRQQGCLEQDDLLRPYSSLDYAWDEPALTHRLVLEQPGGRKLGVYDLDRVGNRPAVVVPATSQRAEQRIRVRVQSDGPRRVLELVDQLVHVQLSSAQQELARAQLGWEPWSGTLYPGPVNRPVLCSPALAGISLEVQVTLGGVGLSLVGQQQEVLYGRVSGIQVRAVTGVARQTLELAVQQVQVDNPATDAAYPVAVTFPHIWSGFGRVVTAVAAAATAGVPRPAALCLRWSVWRSRPGNVLCVERLQVQAAPVLLEIQQVHVMQLLALAQAIMAPLKQESVITVRHRIVHEPDLAVTRPGGRQHIGADKVHIEYLHISQLLLTLSFTPSPGGTTGLQKLVSFAGEVEGLSLRLAVLEVHHPLLSQQALMQLLQWHYIRAARPQLYKLVGSANVIGAPMSVLHHLGLGVWSFLASPAQGIIESTQGGGFNLPRLLSGFVQGCHSLTNNVVLAFTTSTVKIASAVRRGLASLGLDNMQATGLPGSQRLHEGAVQSSALPSGQPGFLAAAVSGCSGLVSEPIRGITEGSLSGLLWGLFRGGLGVFVLPLNSLLGTAAALSGSVRNRLLGPDILAPRLRPPRHVSSREPLGLYTWIDALGRALLRNLEGGRYAKEGFVACRQLQSSTEYIIVTRVHLLAVTVPYLATSSWAPSLTWAAALGDVELCRVQPGKTAELSVLVMQPVIRLEDRQLQMARKALGLRMPPSSPWQHHSARFEVRQDANTIAGLATYGRDQIVNSRLLPVLQGGFLGSSWHATCLQNSQAQ